MNQYKKSLFLIPFLLVFVSEAAAQIKWDEPKVVNEKLYRKNRRVLRFSGVTKPKARVRIRKNRVKFHLDSGKTRTASIPRKNALQFPVIADKKGFFSFDLYLPTTFVEIPVEVKRRGGKTWKPSSLKFQVPERGSVNDLQSIEESFTSQVSDKKAEDIIADIESEELEPSRVNEGMVIRDRNERRKVEKMALRLWAGLGTSYFLTNVASSLVDYDESGSDLVLPAWRLGVDWDFSSEFHLRVNMYQGSGTTDDIGSGPNVVGSQSFSWNEFQISLIWFSRILHFLKTKNLAFDLGFQYQSLPFYRQSCDRTWNENEYICRFSYFDNSVYNLHFGFFYKNNFRAWNYEVYGRYVFPVTTSKDVFEMNSLLPINYKLGGVVRRSITKNLSFGIDAQLQFLGADVKYEFRDIENSEIVSGLDLLLFSLGGRFIMDF